MPEQRLADYLTGALTDEERAALEAELAADPEGWREVVQQRSLEAALGALLNPKAARLEAAILASHHRMQEALRATNDGGLVCNGSNGQQETSWSNPATSNAIRTAGSRHIRFAIARVLRP